MTIKNQKQQMMVKDGGSTSPDTEIVKPVRQAPESREAAIYKPRNGILRNLTTEKAATSQPDKQAAIQKQLLRQAEQGSGYTSPPAELGAQSKELHSALTSQVLPLAIKRVEATAAGLGAEKARRKYEARTWYMEQLLQAYRKEPSEQIAALYNKAYDAVGQDYYAYLRSRVAQKAAVEDYQSVERAYQGALTAYQDYIRREQQRYDQWRGAIRDPETVKPELDAVRSELTALQQADALGALGHNAGAAMQVYNNDLALQWEPYQGNAARIAQLTAIRDALQEEYDYGQYYRYESLRQNPDFEERSKYVSTANGKEEFNALAGMHTNTGFDDIYYDYINRNEDARNRQNLRDIQSNAAFLGIDKSYLEQMTDDEIALFNYVYATQGQEAAYDYVKYLTKGLNQRQRAELEEYWASYARAHPFASSVFSVLESPLKGLGYIGQTADYLTKGAIDENAGYNRFSHINSAIRGAVSRKLEESGAWGKVGSFAYQTGMSMGDFLFNTAITGGNQALSLAIMGTGAAADATIEAKDRGLEDWQAYTLGTVAGLAEVITEKVSLETLLNPDLLKNGALQYIVKNMLAEGSEEVGSDLINLFADILVSQDKSEWMDSVRAYRAEGRTDQEAFGLAFRDQALAMGLDFLGGAISGGIMAGGGAAAYNRYTGKLGAELGKQGLSQEDKMAFIQEGLQSDPDTASYQIAQRLEAQIEAGKEISDTDLARLWQANDQAIQQERLDDQNQAAAQEERTAAQETELRGLELPAVESDPLTAQDAPRNNELTAENDVTLPGGTPLSVAEQLRRINDGIGGIENEPTQGYEQSGADIADAPGGTGNRISDGGPQRNAGAGAGKQAGGVGGGAIREERWRFEHTKAADQRNHSARNIRRISSQELGLRSGTEQRSIKAMPEEIWDGEMRQTADRIYQETGRPVTYVLGKLQVRYGSGRLGRVRGVFTGNGIIVQADNVEATVTQIADHEAFHAKIADEGQWITREIRRRIIGRYSEAEFSRVLDDYLDKLDGAIDMRGAREGAEYEARAMEVMEEVFADAYAGINAFGAHAERWTEEVNQFMDEHHMGKLQNQENGTARPTGPPAERYSIGRTTDNRPFVNVEEDILAGVPQSEWVKKVKENLKEKFPSGITVGNNEIYIDSQSRKELAYSNYMRNIRRNNPQAYSDKLRATNNADEVLLAADNWVNEEQKHSRRDHIRDFARGTALLRIGENDYTAEVVVATENSGRMKLYDILRLKKTQFTEREMDAGEAENPFPGTNRHTASISEESIADGGQNVNWENTVAARERSFEEEYGLKLPSLEDDDETAQNAGAQAERYSYGEQRPNYVDVEIHDAEVEEGVRAVTEMEPVTTIVGTEFSVGEKDLVTQVEEFFAQRGGIAFNPQLGDITLDRRGVKDDLSHGIGRKKAAAFAAVPEVLEYGRVIDYRNNWKGRGYDTAVIAAPIIIGTEENLMGVVVKRSNRTNRFYVHEVLTTKNGAMPFKTGTPKRGTPGGNAPSVISILDDLRTVKNENVQEPSFEEEYRLKLPSLEDEDGAPQNAETPGERYSIADIQGEAEDYGPGVVLDTNIFDGVKPRNWGAILSGFVYKNLAGAELTVFDEAGDPETIYLAKENERVRKNGGGNSHKVLDKLARYRGDNVAALATVHLSELLETSRYENTTDEHSHQWMDENGWEYRRAYMEDLDGSIYEATLNIANGRDRRILYAINNVRKIDRRAAHGVVPSTDTGRGSHIKSNSSESMITDESRAVKKKNFGERYSTDNSDTEQKKPARRKAAEPVAESKPIIAKRDLRNTMLNLFSIPAGRRAELGTVIDQYADRLIKNGALTEDDLRMFFDRMYASGVMTIEADAAFAEGRNYIREGRIYVPQSIRAEFGDDWSGLRRRAFGAGVYLTNNPADAGIDAWNADLAGTLPWLFDSEELDQGRILERIVQVAEEGRDEKVSLAEYTARLAEMEHTPEDEFLDNMERQMDWALRTFAEKANLELHLRDRTGKKIAQEREVFAARSREQRMREAQRRAEERENRKALARRQQEKKALSELQKKTLKQLQWLSKNRNRAPEELRAAFDEVLSDIDLFAVGAANEMRWSDKHNATWKDVVTLYDEMKREDENFFESAELERMATRLRGRKLEDLDVDALNDLYRLAVGVRTVYSNRNKMLQSEREQRIDEAYMDSVREIENAPGGYKGNPVDKFLNLEQLTPINVIQRMGGWDPGGTFYSMGKQLEQGERNVRAFRVKANRMLQDFLTEHENWVKRADGQGKNAIWYEITVPKLLELRMGDRPIFGDTVTVYMTPAQKVHMYLESKSQDNLRHIAFGGRTFANKELYGQGKRKEAFAQGRTICLAPETVKTIVSDLTAEEMELAGILERYYNGLAHDEINKASNELYGYDKAIGRNYAPIYTNDSYTRKEIGVLDVTVEGQGPLQERQKHAGNASLNISCFDAFERNVEKISNFCGLAIPVRNWNALMNSIGQNKSMRDVIAHKWGGEANDYLTKMIKDIQGGETYEADIISTRMDKLMGNYISAVFGFNFSIVFKQLGSIPLASAYLGASNFPSVAQIARIDRGLISKYTQDLEWRTMGYSMPETKQLKDNPNWTQTNRITRFVFGGGAITAMDGWAASTLWPWAENKVRREFPDLEIGTQAQIEAGESPFYKKVAEEFENAVARSQSTSDFIHQSNLRKSKNTLAKAFTMFRSDSAQTYNALRQLIGEAQYYAKNGAADDVLRRAKKAAGTAVLSALVGYSWAELVELFINLWKHKGKKYRDDDDELTAESVAQELAMGLVGDMAGVVTGGEELIDILGNIFTGEKWYGIDTPGMEQLNDVLEACMDAGKGVRDLVTDGADILKNGGDLGAYFRRHGNDILGGIKDFAGVVATYFPGLPVNNLEAYLLGIVKWVSPELQTAYEDLMQTVDKSGLSGLEGDALAFRVGSILDNRRISREETTAQALAELYEAGYKGAVPGDIPGSLSIDGESVELKPYQKQSYDAVWGQTVAGALDDLITSEGFADADPEAREKMLKDLYAYAAEQAKAVLFDEYEIGSSAQKIQEMTGAGLSLAECMVWNSETSGMKTIDKLTALRNWDMTDEAKKAVIGTILGTNMTTESGNPTQYAKFQQALSSGLGVEDYLQLRSGGGDIDDYLELVEAGADTDIARRMAMEISGMEPPNGAKSVREEQKWRAAIDAARGVDEQLEALAAVMSEKEYGKVELANSFGVSPDAYVALREIRPAYDLDGNGAYKQTEIQAAIDAMDGEGYALTMEQKAVLWQIATGSSSAKNNPYSQRVGERVLDTKEDLTFQEEVERQLRGKG